MINELFTAGILALIFGAVYPLIFSSRDARFVRIGALISTIVAAVLLAGASLIILISGQTISFTVYQPFRELLISFFVDRLAAFFLLIIAAVAGCVAAYSIEYFEHIDGGRRRNILCGCMNIFVLAMVLVVSSATTISFLVFWELMAASSFLLVMYEYTNDETRKAGLFYFVMTQLSTLFVLLGLIALYVQTGSYAMAPLTGMTTPLVIVAFIALFLGFSIKAGIIPFHKWLPYAHPASPSPISALMSGVMLKVAVYGLIRFLLFIFHPGLWWGILILVAGTVSAVLGIIYALKEHDIKAMLAYSSIENIGIIFVGIGLSVILTAAGLPFLATLSLLGALFHSLNHALFKSLLFLSSGSVVHATHTRDIEHMGGLAHSMPYTSALFFVGALSIAALPPFNGFASELMIYTAFFSSVASVDPLLKVLLFLSLALFALTGALSMACFVKGFGSVFLALPRSDEANQAKEVPFMMVAGPGVLAVACILLGLFSYQILAIFGYPGLLPDMFLVGVLLVFMAAMTFVVLYFGASREVRISETWGCGTLSQQPATEYTGHGFSEPIDIVFSVLYQTRIRNERSFADRLNCIFSEGRGEIRLMKIFEEYLYLPVAQGSMRVASAISRFQNGCLDTYLLYVFATVVAIFAFLGWFAR